MTDGVISIYENYLLFHEYEKGRDFLIQQLEKKPTELQYLHHLATLYGRKDSEVYSAEKEYEVYERIWKISKLNANIQQIHDDEDDSRSTDEKLENDDSMLEGSMNERSMNERSMNERSMNERSMNERSMNESLKLYETALYGMAKYTLKHQKDAKKAYNLFVFGIRKFDSSRCIYQIGKILENHPNVDTDTGDTEERVVRRKKVSPFEKAFQWYKRAAEKNYPASYYRLGMLYLHKRISKPDHVISLEWNPSIIARKYFERGSDLEHAKCFYMVGLLHEKGKGFEQRSHSKAALMFQRAAGLGYEPALFKMGLIYQFGYGSQWKIDLEKAISYFKLCKNHKEASTNLGIIYLAMGDTLKALKYFRKGSLAGCAKSYFNLGLLYFHGAHQKGNSAIKQSYTKAFSFFQVGARLGSIPSHNMIGVMYANGLGIELNYVNACRHFETAAAQKNSQAFLNLGKLYQEGNLLCGIDYGAALECYQKAKELGHPKAMESLIALNRIIQKCKKREDSLVSKELKIS